jgi:transcription-repair coupling factor (superfamily II helicase)
LYAKKTRQRFQFAPDSYLQNELESSFIYEDTPDQTKSTAEVKPIWSDRPMDRLVCGDVGFGKTEVAIRAAFKAVDNKQVAYCAYNNFGLPALPHFYRAFKRYAGFYRVFKSF